MFNFYTEPPEITPFTAALVAQRDSNNKPMTMVLEEQGEYAVRCTPSKMIDHACKYFGSSLKGRQDGTRDICGITHKAPITVDPLSGMYFFPTISPSSSQCTWIAHSHIDQVQKKDEYDTEIIFHNGKSIVVEISYGSMLNQIQRTAQFRYLLNNRLKFLKKHIDQPELIFPTTPQK
ncbi:competence protein ComK [Virgibacillus pantothenticus]|uniref:competence protein ComK n=1 Tax=Virgibacillus pantothenticus TaxID=1473 RepID=UPI0009876E43|nr:competence protein ComK [Virgibacillus pantothenticus]